MPRLKLAAWDGSWDEARYRRHMATSPRRRGYIEALPSNRFRAVVYAGLDPLTGKRRNLTETAGTHAEAEVALTKLLRQVSEQRHPKSALMVAEAVAQWLDVAELQVTTRSGTTT